MRTAPYNPSLQRNAAALDSRAFLKNCLANIAANRAFPAAVAEFEALGGITRIQKLTSTFLLVLLCIIASSCSDADGFSKKSGDLGAFLLERSAKFGARPPSTSTLPKFTGDWRYKEDQDGFQIYLDGDRFAELQSFLTAAFGPPEQPPKTNSIAGTQSVGTHYGVGLGVALSYAWEQTRDGKQITSVVVVRRQR